VERRFAVHARAYRQALTVIAVLLVASPALAAPKTAKARAAFDAGLAAYKTNDYAGAAEAFGTSYGIEADLETLFAWAQAERQAEHCDQAIVLYEKLLKEKLPEANLKVVNEKLGECRQIVAANKPPPPEPTPDPQPAPQPEPPQVQPRPEPPPQPQPPPEGHPSRWKDPIGLGLVTAGAIGLGVGGYFLASAKTASADSKSATNYFDALELKNRAESRGKIGVVSTIAGGALLVGGIVRFVMHESEHHAVTGWVTPDGGGVLATGRF